MTDPNKTTVPEREVTAPRPTRYLSATERRAAHFAEIATKQATLKAEAAERRAVRQARMDAEA